MFRETNRQMPLLSAASQLAESARRRLIKSWADGFRRRIYPQLLDAESEFADLYDEGNGRPNWSVARRLGVCFLQDMMDLDDQSALDALAFDARWHHALDLTADEAYLSRRGLIDFRGRLVERDPEMARLRKLFDRITQAAIDDLGLSTNKQRLDSTFFTSNIRTRGRLDLFRKTLAHFLDWLASWAPSKREGLDEAMLAWHGRARQGVFGKQTRAQVDARLIEVAEWLVEVLECFAEDEEVHSHEPYQLVVRLVAEHCERVDVAVVAPSEVNSEVGGDDDSKPNGAGGGAELDVTPSADGEDDGNGAPTDLDPPLYELLAAPVNGGASLQSPHDPDAGYGHKGKGYLAQITETCGNEGSPEIITDFDVHGSHGSDHGKASEALDRLEATGLRPDELFADAGYTSGQELLNASERGVALRAPVTLRGQAEDALLRHDFTYGDQGEVSRCPGGHEPVRHGHRVPSRGRERTLHAYFDAATCRGCPLLARCPVKVAAKARTVAVEVGSAVRARDRAIADQRESAWWRNYSIRSGIEATNSELKRAHGFGRLRVRGRARVLLAVTSKLTACNIKRWIRAAAAGVRLTTDGPAVTATTVCPTASGPASSPAHSGCSFPWWMRVVHRGDHGVQWFLHALTPRTCLRPVMRHAA